MSSFFLSIYCANTLCFVGEPVIAAVVVDLMSNLCNQSSTSFSLAGFDGDLI